MEPGDHIVITGMTWASGRPELRIRRNGDASVLHRLTGLALSYSTGPDAQRHCIGHKPFRNSGVAWQDCDRTPLHDGRTCDRCAASDATFASQLHHAHNRGMSELDPAVRTHLEQPNSLYLAMFRDGSVKVGTSTAPRLSTRLEEQGAWIAQVVASTTDGFAVRSLEDRATTDLGLAQSVSVKRKLNGLVTPLPNDRLRQELATWAAAVTELIVRHGDDRVEASSVEWETTVGSDPMWSGVHQYPLKLHSGNHDIEFIGASGRVGVISRPTSSDRFVADVRSLFGVELSLADVVPDELAVQDSLF